MAEAERIPSSAEQMMSIQADRMFQIIKWERKMNYIYCWMLRLVDVTHVPLCEMWRHADPPTPAPPPPQPTAGSRAAGQTWTS